MNPHGALILKYEAVILHLLDNPETVVESTWRGLLATFAAELSALDK
jgi:hypothetical protein